MGFLVENKEDFSAPLVLSFLTEFLGTALLLFLGCMGCYDVFGMGPLLPALSFGLSVLMSLQVIGHFSPCHINPAISLGFVMMGTMHWLRFIVYVVAQYIGAFAGYALLWCMLPSHTGLCLLRVKLGTVGQAFGLEFLGTMMLMMTVAGACDPKCERYVDSKYLKIIFVLSGIVVGVETFTGCGINPARALPPAVLLNNWKDHWLYQVAPMCGSAFGALLYRFVYSDDEPHSLSSWLRGKAGKSAAED